MTTSKITMIDGVPTVSLTQEILEAIGFKPGDEVDVSVSGQKLIIRATAEAERAAKMNRIFAELLIERDSVYRRLAEGVK